MFLKWIFSRRNYPEMLTIHTEMFTGQHPTCICPPPGGRPVFRPADVRAGEATVQQRVELRPPRYHPRPLGGVPGRRGQRPQGQQHSHMEGGKTRLCLSLDFDKFLFSLLSV